MFVEKKNTEWNLECKLHEPGKPSKSFPENISIVCSFFKGSTLVHGMVLLSVECGPLYFY